MTAPVRWARLSPVGDLLKSFLSPDLVRRLAADIARVHPSFPERA